MERIAHPSSNSKRMERISILDAHWMAIHESNPGPLDTFRMILCLVCHVPLLDGLVTGQFPVYAKVLPSAMAREVGNAIRNSVRGIHWQHMSILKFMQSPMCI